MLALVLIGCAFVVLDFAPASPIVHVLPNPALRRALTGFLFGATGGSIAWSPVGRVSGAHLNPVVTLGFWIHKKLSGRMALAYVASQLAGSIVGAWLLSVVAGSWARAVHDAATVPGPDGVWWAAVGEVGATFCLVMSLFLFLRHPRVRRYTPMIFSPLYAILVWLEAPLSGTSTNPARSLGPALVSQMWHGWWAYWIGPLAGAGLALGLLHVRFPQLWQEIGLAKIAHLNDDPGHIFHRERWHGPFPVQHSAQPSSTLNVEPPP